MLEFNGNVSDCISINEVKKIPDVKGYSDKEANDTKAFWDDIFKVKETEEDVSIDDENIFAEIFGRSEDEFEFDFDIEANDVKATLADFSQDIWDTLSENERLDRILSLIKVIAEKLGIDNVPELFLFDAVADNCGAFNPRDNVLKINRSLFEDPKELVNTIAHEMRHAFQSMRAEIGETTMDLLYALNFENYISPVPVGDGKVLFYIDYEDQLVETEARAFANLFS